ncbi:hypothetical protein N0V86_004400 [Didymella sp. IMI 355093]|nr:hypothetical protein N0V86_004400 [Didymella sp. IMI 355093]
MEFGVNDPAHFVRFPSHLLPPGEHVKAGILMSTRCDEALARTHFLSVKLLQISLNLRAVPLTVHTISTDRKQKLSNWPAVKHTVLAIQSLQTDKEWIIDITGAQYGISSPPHRWDEYEASHVKHVIQTFAHGYNEMLIGELAKIKGNPMMQCSLLIKVSNVMEQAVVAWESQHGQVHSLVVLPEADFVVQKQSLLVTMDTAARNFIAATDFSADTRTAEKYEQGHPMASLKEAQEMLVRIRESHANQGSLRMISYACGIAVNFKTITVQLKEVPYKIITETLLAAESTRKTRDIVSSTSDRTYQTKAG